MSKETMRERKEDTMQKILNVAWDMAIQDGLESISIRKIATAMHFAPNNLYHYFKDKQELLYRMKKDAYEWAIVRMNDNIPELSDPIQKIQYITKMLLHAALEEPQKYFVMTSDLIMDSKEPLDTEILKAVSGYVQEGIAMGSIKELDPTITAMNLRAMVVAFIRMVVSIENMTMEQADMMLTNFMTLLLNGITVQQEVENE